MGFFSEGACQKAWEIFQEMESHNIPPDSIAYSSLMKSFNKGSQPERVLAVAKLMKEKRLPFNSAISFQILSACSM